MRIYAWMLLAPIFAPAKHAPQSCLLQTGQSRSLAESQDSTDLLEHNRTESDEDEVDDGGDSEFVPEVVEMLKQMEEMSLNKSVGSQEVSQALNTMMKKFDAVVNTQFQTAFAETQAEIKRHVLNFESAHRIAMKAKQRADSANLALGDCRQQEALKFEAYAACLDESRWLNKTWEDSCKKMERSRFYKWGIDTHLKKQHVCDLADPLCPKLDDLKGHVDALASLLTSQRQAFNDNHAKCNASRDAALNKATECELQHVDFLGKKTVCEGQAVSTQVSMCAFGYRLQEQCGLLDGCNKFIYKVRDGTGTRESETDRRNNWLKAQSMKCLLKSYTAGGSVDDDVKSLCERDHSYKDDVGEMDYMSDKILSLLRPAPPSFTCHETHILFEGPLWQIGNLTDKYVMKERTEDAVNITPAESSPFQFCAANSSRMPCRGFQCPSDWTPRPESIDSTCELKVCSKYECCKRVVGLFAKRHKPVVGAWEPSSDEASIAPGPNPVPGLSEGRHKQVAAPAELSSEEVLDAPPSNPAAGLFADRGRPMDSFREPLWDEASKEQGSNPVAGLSSEFEASRTNPAAGLSANRARPVVALAGPSSGGEMLDDEMETLATHIATGSTSEKSLESLTLGTDGTGPQEAKVANLHAPRQVKKHSVQQVFTTSGENEIMAKRSPRRSDFGA